MADLDLTGYDRICSWREFEHASQSSLSTRLWNLQTGHEAIEITFQRETCCTVTLLGCIMVSFALLILAPARFRHVTSIPRAVTLFDRRYSKIRIRLRHISYQVIFVYACWK